jgi:tetratricopeptide (TPR) repeat protein
MRVLDYAEGNPFYVEEVIRSLIDGEVIVYDEAMAQWEATRRVEDIAIPDTLQGVLMARIDRLADEAKRVLQMASVIGRIFLYRVLSAIAEEEQELDARLLTLQREEMIRERARVPELEYIFKHHLTREAAYNGLLKRERRLFHRQVVEALERLFPDRVEEQLGRLARHWDEAGEREKAADYLRRAGEQAAAQYANAEALSYFSQALALTAAENLAGRYGLLLVREQVYHVQGAREAQRRELAVLEGLAEALHDDARRAEVALRQARWAYDLPDYPMQIAAAQRAVRLAHASGDARTEARGYRWWGRALRFQGDHTASQFRLEQALTLARATRLRGVEAGALLNLGSIRFGEGEYVGAAAYWEEALQIWREIGDRRLEYYQRLRLGALALEQGDYEEARLCYQQAVHGFRLIGDRWHEGFAHSLAGQVYHCLGDYETARDRYEQYLSSCRQVGDRRGEALALCYLSLLSYHVGDDETSREHAQQALQMARDQGDRLIETDSLICLGHALTGLSSLDEARDAYGQCVAFLRELGQSHQGTDALAGLARVSLAQGNLLRAQDQVEEILGYLDDHALCGMVDVGEPFRVYLTCCHVMQANGDSRAKDVLHTAYKLLQGRATKISDEGDRRSYLENVAANRDIVKAYTGAKDMTATQGE